MALRQSTKRRKVRFEAAKVFPAEVTKDDLEFDLDLEVARYKASKGEGGSRSPPEVPPSDSGTGTSWYARRWAA